MATTIAIPKLGMTMKEAKIVAWKFNEGDWVEKDQVVMEIETAKVTYEVEALESGFLHILAAPEDVLPVGGAAGLLAVTKEELAELQVQQPGAVVAAAQAAEKPAAASAASGAGPKPEGRVKISPAAKKIAQDAGLDYMTIVGTGPGGRIVKEDVEKAIEAARSAPAAAAAAPAAPAPSGEVIDGKRVKKMLPLKGMRKVIADHMVHSLQVGAQLSTLTEVDATELVKLRKALLQREKMIGVRVTYNDILVYILARALKVVPMMNASLIDGKIVLWEDINVGVAVALQLNEFESGLIVPVVKNADQKSLAEINRHIADVVEKARGGTILPDEVTGSTFTLTNTGAFGSGWAWGTPIINQPESAILQTGAIMDRPAAVDGQVVVRPMMPLSLTFDHRVLDGAPAGAFMGAVAELIQNPALLIV
ncbi:MAG: 2-oxo acid dehydrogenase subunit E2 [Proteobacteria bacterium]|nr:2-oxo acid dehydrogenase subunit E2 [Pseudomonadota bacterium]